MNIYINLAAHLSLAPHSSTKFKHIDSSFKTIFQPKKKTSFPPSLIKSLNQFKMQFNKSLLLSLFVLGATAFDHIYARDEANANDQVDVRDALQAAHDIAMRSTDPDLFRREVKSAPVDQRGVKI
jgi:hypothetical protein